MSSIAMEAWLIAFLELVLAFEDTYFSFIDCFVGTLETDQQIAKASSVEEWDHTMTTSPTFVTTQIGYLEESLQKLIGSVQFS
jgi:hypothetical protein